MAQQPITLTHAKAEAAMDSALLAMAHICRIMMTDEPGYAFQRIHIINNRYRKTDKNQMVMVLINHIFHSLIHDVFNWLKLALNITEQMKLGHIS